MMVKKNFIRSFLITLFAIFCIFYILFNIFEYVFGFVASRKLPENFNQEYLRIKIYGSSTTESGNTVSGTFSIIDTNGNEIATIERSWSGAYLAVEFAQIKFADKYFIFPSHIYGKNRIIEEKKERKKGTDLEKYYNDYGQCMLYGYGTTWAQRKALYQISTLATGKFKVINIGLISNFSIDLSGCSTDKYYSIFSDEKGNLFVKEL